MNDKKNDLFTLNSDKKPSTDQANNPTHDLNLNSFPNKQPESASELTDNQSLNLDLSRFPHDPSSDGLKTDDADDNNLTELDDKLFDLLDNAVPLVDNTADAFRFIFFAGLAVLGWIFAWMFFIKSFTLTTALVTVGLVGLPLLLLFRFWLALEELKDLPNLARRLSNDISSDVKASFKGLTSNPAKGKANLLGQIKNLYQLKGLVGGLGDVFGQYLSIVSLLNPLSLLFTVFALLFMFALMVVGVILVFV